MDISFYHYLKFYRAKKLDLENIDEGESDNMEDESL